MTGISGIGSFDPRDLQEMRRAMFQDADADGSGTVNIDEMKEALFEKGISAEKAEKLFNKIDINGNGEVTQAESDEAFEKMRSAIMAMIQGGLDFSSDDEENENKDPLKALFEVFDTRNTEERKEIQERLKKLQDSDPAEYEREGSLASGSYGNLIELKA